MHFDFIEIGTADFEACIENASDETFGISIEPVSKYLNRLPTKKNVFKLNAAISDGLSSSVEIFYLNDDALKQFPMWARGCNTINRIHPLIKKHLTEMNLKVEDCIIIDKVKAYTVQQLVEMYNITSIDYLKIDTEGYDCYIMEQYYDCISKNKNLKAKKIMFETNENSSDVHIKKVNALFTEIGYRHIGDVDGNGNSWPNTILSL